MNLNIESIGVVHSPFNQKFGIPRQPDLVPAAHICIELKKEFTPDCVRGLEAFEYIWVQFVFHDAIAEGWAQMVRPPRLGGKKKMGVFATRSPHRPNHIGLSLLKLLRIDTANGAVKLYCGGGDLLSGTPVIDIKPYLVFVEAKPQAVCGFVQDAPQLLCVVWQCDANWLPENTRQVIEQSLAQDPRPAYHDTPQRIYYMEMAGCDVRFRVENKTVFILSVGDLCI